jgi:hypothetical protein
MAHQFYVVKSEDGRYYDYFMDEFTKDINNHCIHHIGNAKYYLEKNESKKLNAKLFEVDFVIGKTESKD